ncbi:ada regulatory protein [Vibrio orientalis CIP 102891 = ATCC 33934]|uniref:Ada regulatory protein n=1 Tax=Vibrio orientalis CIP 102891 = ATCC 33934 TaxID=675816 RepID=C9QEP7_VIBOR|nr:AlkA N-terminal domain-containing protein [Vibrio orientalis]EEX94520.1 ada regulatory protein [Vibrio orientalis CIP 102891 = ATCC 33934]EGU53928.1 ada regulatory protein [Vibrio orientalis CIP 102891 = ATCC 33934]
MEVSLNKLTQKDCHIARMARDRRFDGRFYVAVKTTGIFCRPICPANLPKEENVEYFLDKAQALQAGYRPCLRCRPDSAPSSWAWKGVEATFQRAVKLIEQGDLTHSSLTELSERLGISDRYLRKLFNQHIGMSPKQYAICYQLMFAKQLLHTTKLTVTDIALASGFNSVRRFNDAFKQTLKLAPSQIRKETNLDNRVNHVDLAFRGAFDWQHMLDFYQLRAIEGLERVTSDSYQRYIQIEDCRGWFSISNPKSGVMRVEFKLDDMSKLRELINQVRRMFDLDSDVLQIESHLSSIEPELIKRSGIRIPGVWSPWEAGVRAILGQQVSIKAAIGQLNLLTQTLQSNGVTHFPTPQEISQADLSFLKMPQSRKETLARFACYMMEHADAPLEHWLDLKGIGPWTVNYARLRGNSEPNCFLDSDLVVKKSCQNFTNLTTETVSPWGSYATFHCWSHA